jgi:hypothetical protein
VLFYEGFINIQIPTARGHSTCTSLALAHTVAHDILLLSHFLRQVPLGGQDCRYQKETQLWEARESDYLRRGSGPL